MAGSYQSVSGCSGVTAKSWKCFGKAPREVDLSKGSSDVLGRAPAAIGRRNARIRVEPAFEDARQACEDSGRIGWDNR